MPLVSVGIPEGETMAKLGRLHGGAVRCLSIAAFGAAIAFALGSYATAQQNDPDRKCAVLVFEGQFGHIEVCVSSILPAQKGNRYGPEQVFDGDPATAWVEGAPEDGRGQWIEYLFEWPMRLQSFEILAGYAKSRKAHQNNARPKDVRVFADGEFIETIRLEDTMSVQRVTLSEPVEAEFFRLEIASSYRGNKWQDLAVSEFYVDLEELNYQ